MKYPRAAPTFFIVISLIAPVTWATTVPTVTITSPADGATLTAPATIELAFAVADPSGILGRVELYRDTTLVCSGGGTFNCSSPGVPAGTYQYSARGYDKNGALLLISNPVSVTVNPSPGSPTLSLSGTSMGFIGTSAGAAAQVLVLRNPGPAGSVLHWQAQAKPAWLTVSPANGTLAAGGGQPLSVSVNTQGLGGVPGHYDGTITFLDSGATNSPQTVGVTLDILTAQSAATVRLTAPADQATFTALATINLSAAASYPSGTISRVEFYQGSTLLGTDTTNPYSFTWANVPAGTYALSARSYDSQGALSISNPVSVTVNALPGSPTMAVSGTSLGFIGTPAGAASHPLLLGNVGPAGSVLHWQAQASPSWLAVSPANGTLAAGASQSLSVSVNTQGLGNGSYNGTITFSDSGATNSPQTVAVSFDMTLGPSAATVSMTSPADHATFTAPATIHLAYSVNDPDGTIRRVILYEGANRVCAGGGLYSCDWGSVPAGTYQLSARAYDQLGALLALSNPISISVTGNAPPASPSLSLSRTALGFVGTTAGGNSGPQTVTLSNSGPAGTLLNWLVSSDQAWLIVSPSNGTLTSNADQLLSVSVDTSGLADGSYSGTISFTDPGATNSPQTVAVSLAVSSVSGSGNLPAIDPSNLPSSVGLNESLSINNYPIINATFLWTFSAAGSPLGAPGIRSATTLNPAGTSFSSGVKTASLASYGLNSGTYEVTVLALDASGNKSPVLPATIKLVSSNLSQVKVYPNPWRADRHAAYPRIRFANLPSGATVKLFTISGHWIKTLGAPSAGISPWDLTNDAGDKVASGIYLYLIRDEQGNKTRGKVAVIR